MQTTRQQLAAETDRGRRSSHDEVIDGFLTIYGVERRIESDAELTEQILAGEAGIEIIDLRGLKKINDALGYHQGNILLNLGGARLDTGRRHRKMRIDSESDRRTENMVTPDICLRGAGSDELIMFTPGVHTVEHMRAIHYERIMPAFSVKQGIRDSRTGSVPIVANAAYAHVLHLPLQESLPNTSYERAAVASEIFKAMVELAKEHLTRSHDAQLAAMRACVLETYDPAVHGPINFTNEDTDPRLIVDSYWRVCCPDFYHHMAERLEEAFARHQVAPTFR